MLVETTGTWDAGASMVIKHIALAVAAIIGDDPDKTHATMLQELCVAVRAYRARAALRRRSDAIASG